MPTEGMKGFESTWPPAPSPRDMRDEMIDSLPYIYLCEFPDGKRALGAMTIRHSLYQYSIHRQVVDSGTTGVALGY